MNNFYLFPIITAVTLFAISAIALLNHNIKTEILLKITEGLAFNAFIFSTVTAFTLFWFGAGTSFLIGTAGIGLSARVDVISVTMLCLVSFIGWIVLRYSSSYLNGEAGQGDFIGWMAATLASVLMVVSSGNLSQLVIFWIATSLCLHKLLLFYPNRQSAIRAARKKFIIARIADSIIWKHQRIDVYRK